MAIITSYPQASPSEDDYVLGTRFGQNKNPTRLFPIQGIIDLVEATITTPTLQQVTTAGDTTNVPTIFATTDPLSEDINSITTTTDNGIAVFASSDNGTAVDAYSINGTGIKSLSSDGIAILGFSSTNTGIEGKSTDGIGIYGESVNEVGIFAFSFNDTPFVADTIEGNDLNIAEFKRNGANQCSISYDGTVTSSAFVIPGGTSDQYLMADGSVTTGGGTTPTLQEVVTAGDRTFEKQITIGGVDLYSEFSAISQYGVAVSQGTSDAFGVFEDASFTRSGLAFQKNVSFGALLEKVTIFRNGDIKTTVPDGLSSLDYYLDIPVKSGTIALTSDIFKPGLFAQTALGALITNTTVETSLTGTGVGSLTVPANTFQVGDSFTAKICGPLSCANNETIHIRVKSNGITIADAGVFQMKIATDKYFELSMDFTVTKIGAAEVAELFTNGQYSYNHNSTGDISGNNFALISNTTFDTTIVNVLSITAQWGAASASNKIQSQNFVLTKVY
jgi:hypothetical protein